jgi:ankyrin repeat protein
MPKNSFERSLRVDKPCNQAWEEMTGNDTVRFCSHCAKNVNFISGMTRREARRVVKRSSGRLCIRYEKDSTSGQPLFADSLIQITRRAPRLAAGVLGATFGLASLSYGQEPAQEIPEVVRTQDPVNDGINDANKGSAKLSGMVVGPDGNVIAGARVIATSLPGNKEFSVDTGTDGKFIIESLPAGRYSLLVNGGLQYEMPMLTDVELDEHGEDFRVVELTVREQQIFISGAIAVTSALTTPRSELAQAVYIEELDEVRDLLARGADPNEEDEDGKTVLFMSVEDGTTEIARELLSYKADADHRSKDGRNPLFAIDDETPEELVRMLIDAGSDVSVKDSEGFSVLMHAAENASPKVLKMLIDAGAAVNDTDERGWTPLMKAAYADELENVRILLFAGADVNARNADGENAWDQTGVDEIESLLVSFGSDITEQTEDDSIPEDTQTEP